MTVFSHAFLAMVQFKVRDAERLFELAATKFQKTGKIKEASISYAEQGNSAILLGKFVTLQPPAVIFVGKGGSCPDRT